MEKDSDFKNIKKRSHPGEESIGSFKHRIHQTMFASSFRRFVPRVASIARPAHLLSQNMIRFSSTINKINLESIVQKFSEGPVTVKYTQEHEWVASHPDGTAFIGITTYAADALGDATYIELPEVTEDVVTVGDSIGSVESVKSASEIYSPVEGEVVEVNDKLNDSPELINSDPMGDGWIAKIKLLDPAQLENGELLTESEYQTFLEEQD